jgi:tryptophan synthase beta chain
MNWNMNMKKRKATLIFQVRLQSLFKILCRQGESALSRQRLSRHCGGAQIYLKREDLNHTGAHKVNNYHWTGNPGAEDEQEAVIAETGAGMHGVATATVAALFGFECEVFMGAVDIARAGTERGANGSSGAKVALSHLGFPTLEEAMNEAIS